MSDTVTLYERHGCFDYRQDSGCNAYGMVERTFRNVPWCLTDDRGQFGAHRPGSASEKCLWSVALVEVDDE